MNNLTIGNHYNNDDICNTFLCAPQGGMRRSHKTNTLVLVANHTKSLYEDEWKLDTMNYAGMGSKGDQSLEFAQNKTLSESNENGINVHFFEVFTDKVYTYQGQVTLIDKPFQEVQDDEDGNSRSVWIFPLKGAGCSHNSHMPVAENIIKPHIAAATTALLQLYPRLAWIKHLKER